MLGTLQKIKQNVRSVAETGSHDSIGTVEVGNRESRCRIDFSQMEEVLSQEIGGQTHSRPRR